MADNFSMGPKLKIDGEAEFKKAIAGINKDMTVLGSEMKNVTAQYADNADSMEALTAKSEVYTKQIDEQKRKIDTIKEALANAAKEYGDNSDKVKEWKIQLNNAEAALANTEGSLKKTKDQMDNYGKETSDAGTETKQLGEKMEGAEKKTISFGDVLKANLISDAIVGGIKAIGSAIAAAAREMADLAKEAIDAADELTNMSAETGLTTERLQEMKFIGDDLGVSLETQTGALSKMINNMSSAKSGTGDAAKAFAKLGISVTDSSGNLRDSNEVYGEVFDALGKVGNETERTAMAQDIFGKSAIELNPLIKAGSQGLADLATQAHESGAVMSDETVMSLDNLGDSIDHMKQSAQTAAGSLLGKFAPALDDVATSLAGMLSGNVSADEFMATINTLVTQVVGTITTMLPTILQTGIQIMTTLMQGIVDAIPAIIPAVVGIVLQLTTTLLEMLPQILQAGLTIIIQLALGIANALPSLIPTIVDTVLMIVDVLLNNIDMLVDAGIKILLGLTDGIIKALPRLVDKIPEIIIKLVSAVTTNLPKIIEAGLQIIIALAGALITNVPKLIAKIPEIIASIVNGFGSYYTKLGEVGLNLITGLWDGIKNATAWLTDKIKSFAQGVVDSIKNFFGIHSPSAVMAGVGEFISIGLAKGITDKAGLVSDAMGRINKDLSAEANISVSGTIGKSNSAAGAPSIIDVNIDYDRLAAAMASKIEGLTVSVDKRPLGRLVREFA